MNATIATSGINLFGLNSYCPQWFYDSNAYNIEQMQRIVFFSGYISVYNLYCIFCEFKRMKDSTISISSISMITLLAGSVIYVLICYVGKQLYDELRLNHKHPNKET